MGLRARTGGARHPLSGLPIAGLAGARRTLAELVLEHLLRHLVDRAPREMAELKRSVSEADQPGDRISQMFENAAHLAVLALLQRQGDPGVGALLAFEVGADRAIDDAVDGGAARQGGEPRRVDETAH